MTTSLPETERGRATRERILRAATAAINEHGATQLNLQDVMQRAGVSKGQLYHYFVGREALLHAATRTIVDDVVELQHGIMEQIATWATLRAWFDCLIDMQVSGDARGGCPIAMLAAHLVETDEHVRAELMSGFDQWERCLVRGFATMQAGGDLDVNADAAVLATATMASLQGGLLLTQVRRDPGQLRIALDAAWSHLRSHAPAAG